MKKTTIGFDEWKEAIAEMNAGQVDKVPDGWISPEQFAQNVSKTLTTSRAILNQLVKAGRAERKKFRVMMTNGPRSVNHYKLV